MIRFSSIYHLQDKYLIKHLSKEIRKLSEKEIYKENYALLLSVPGIGTLTAMIILTELGNIKRFKNLDTLCSYVGLVPMTNSTGENERTGDITVRRNKILRTAIIESSWIAIRHDPVFISTEKYTSISIQKYTILIN